MAGPTTLKGWQALTGEEALNDAEKQLIEACREGEPCILGDGKRPERKVKSRTIRAALLRWLILEGGEGFPVQGWGVRLIGAYVDESLDVSFAKTRGPTILGNCTFAKSLEAIGAHFQLLSLDGSEVTGLNLRGTETVHGLFLGRGFASKKGAFLLGARIGGQLDCRGGSFANVQGGALKADSIVVDQSVLLDDGFNAQGEVTLFGARIGGQLSCRKGIFENSKGTALNLAGSDVHQGVFLDQGFSAKGRVSLSGARIGGQLACAGGSFESPVGHALIMQSLEVGEDVLLSDGFEAKGEVSLSNAKIGGQLSCIGGSFETTQSAAFSAQSIQVHGELFWLGVQILDGEVDLNSAYFSRIVDRPENWPNANKVLLDGMTYDRLSGDFTDAKRRLEWLAKGDRMGGVFTPPALHPTRQGLARDGA